MANGNSFAIVARKDESNQTGYCLVQYILSYIALSVGQSKVEVVSSRIFRYGQGNSTTCTCITPGHIILCAVHLNSNKRYSIVSLNDYFTIVIIT